MSTVTARLEFACPACQAPSTSTVEVAAINWAASDKLSELISEDHVVVVCSRCSEHLDAYVQNTPSMCSITFEEYPAVAVSATASTSPAKPDEWVNTDIPENPYEVFMNSYHHVGDILAEYGEGGSGILSHSARVIHGMVFVHHAAADLWKAPGGSYFAVTRGLTIQLFDSGTGLPLTNAFEPASLLGRDLDTSIVSATIAADGAVTVLCSSTNACANSMFVRQPPQAHTPGCMDAESSPGAVSRKGAPVKGSCCPD